MGSDWIYVVHSQLEEILQVKVENSWFRHNFHNGFTFSIFIFSLLIPVTHPDSVYGCIRNIFLTKKVLLKGQKQGHNKYSTLSPQHLRLFFGCAGCGCPDCWTPGPASLKGSLHNWSFGAATTTQHRRPFIFVCDEYLPILKFEKHCVVLTSKNCLSTFGLTPSVRCS